MTTHYQQARVHLALRPLYDEHKRLADKHFSREGLTPEESRLMGIVRGVIEAFEVLAEVSS